MKRIKLTQGKFALVDNIDFEGINQFKWYVNGEYARRKIRVNGNPRIRQLACFMHRFILNAPKGKVVDHVNGNGLDNRRCNLRVVTNRQNAQNIHKIKSKAKYKGVQKRGNRWSARITVDGKQIFLGSFGTCQEAVNAYDDAAIEHYREFAATNKKLRVIGGM